MSKDPFDEASDELRSLILQCDEAMAKLDRSRGSSSSGRPSTFLLSSLEGTSQAAQEELTLLKEVMTMVAARDFVVRGKKLGSEEISRREKIIHDGEMRLASINDAIMTARTQIAHGNDPFDEQRRQANDDFIQSEIQLQREEESRQDAALERLHHGVLNIREKAITVRDEMNTQETELAEIEQLGDSLAGRMHLVNQRVDKLLVDMSERNRMCCVLFLALIAGLMFGILVFG